MSCERQRALLDRIDAELRDSLEIAPSPEFLPAARRRVAELQAPREASGRWWLVPALAAVAGILLGGHLIEDAARSTATALPPVPRLVPDEPVVPPLKPKPLASAEPQPIRSAETAREPAPGPVGEAAPVVRSLPPVIVPPEDERVVRRLARRLRGRAARAAALAPEVEGPFDFTLKLAEDGREVVFLDQGGVPGGEPGLDEPLSFDRTIEKAGRET